MQTQWMVQTHGDPIGTVREFLQAVWAQANLDGMLVPLDGSEQTPTGPRWIDDPARLKTVNPFKPLMTQNAARLVPPARRAQPNDRLGALLRPCEMRALVEMVKHDGFDLDGLLTISVDCLGTIPLDDFHWRLSRKDPADGLTHDTLQFARQGGILAYRYRSACQICASPAAEAADLNINVLGLPVRQVIMVQAPEARIVEQCNLGSITDGPAVPDMLSQHEKVTARMSERHRRTIERLAQGLGEAFPRDIEALIAQFESCGDCQSCMQVCPICSVDYPQRGQDGHYMRQDFVRWLVSCAGCGMCEQACHSHLPLSAIFRHIRNMLAEEYGYSPGKSVDEPLPVMH